MSRYRLLSQHSGDNVSGSRKAQLAEHLPCKRGVLGLSPSLTANFSHLVIFGAQWGTVHACLVSLRCLVMKVDLRNLRTNFKFEGVLCHATDLWFDPQSDCTFFSPCDTYNLVLIYRPPRMTTLDFKISTTELLWNILGNNSFPSNTSCRHKYA